MVSLTPTLPAIQTHERPRLPRCFNHLRPKGRSLKSWKVIILWPKLKAGIKSIPERSKAGALNPSISKQSLLWNLWRRTSLLTSSPSTHFRTPVSPYVISRRFFKLPGAGTYDQKSHAFCWQVQAGASDIGAAPAAYPASSQEYPLCHCTLP